MSQLASIRDVGSTSSTLTDSTVVELTKGDRDFQNKTAGFMDDEVLLPATELGGVWVPS